PAAAPLPPPAAAAAAATAAAAPRAPALPVSALPVTSTTFSGGMLWLASVPCTSSSSSYCLRSPFFGLAAFFAGVAIWAPTPSALTGTCAGFGVVAILKSPEEVGYSFNFLRY
ncbi:hypothetical protein GCN75_25290, partial [Janthinobacterium violaceinigrum]